MTKKDCTAPLLNRHRNVGAKLLFQVGLLLIVFSLFIVPALLHARSSLDQIEQQYREAKDYYYELERKSNLGNQRQNWLTAVRNFRRIYFIDSTGPKAPSCLYMIGRIHYRMYQRFHLPIDLDESVIYFNDVATLFTHNSLADDALFNTAEIHFLEKKDPKQAAALYLQLVKSYPSGDKHAKAINRLHELEKDHGIGLPETISRSDRLKHLVEIYPTKHWSSDDYTRVSIQASAPVHYSNSLLEKHGNQPRRLYIDFAQSHIDPEYRIPIPIEDGLLKQVRAGQFDRTTVRVVLDIESISHYKIFNLKDPFRVVVDVHGEKVNKDDQPKVSPPVVQVLPKPTPTVAGTGKFTFVTLRDNKKKRPQNHGSRTSPELSLAQQLGLGVRRIIIDPGHGGKDPGATAFGLKEKDIVLEVARMMAVILEEQYGYETLLTRDRDIFLPLEERTAIANTQKADLFISLHINAHPLKNVGGIETYYLNFATNAEAMRVAALENATTTHNISDLQDILTDLMQNSNIQESSLLADLVQSSMVAGLEAEDYGVKDLGVKQAPFYVLLGAEMPAILIELNFITNPTEAKLLAQKEYLNALARKVVKGVSRYVSQGASARLQ
jgi:N-acetylmuramoyl-L-alanine amidase